jgi:hypothetical protein
MNRLPAEELLQVIRISRAEERATQPLRDTISDLDATVRHRAGPTRREERLPACEGTGSSLAPRGV